MASHLRLLLCFCLATALIQGGAAWGAPLAPVPGPASRAAVAPAPHAPEVAGLDVPDDEVGSSPDRQLTSSSAVVGLPGVDHQPSSLAPLSGPAHHVGYRVIPCHILFQSRLI